MTILPKVKLKALVSFPATILDGVGVDTVNVNGTYQFNIAFDDFAPPVSSVADPSHQNVLLWNNLTGVYTLASASLIATGVPSDANPLMNGVVAPGVSVLYSRGDHIHPTDTSRAPLASPVFTGDPQAPTPTAGDNDTSLATTAFVTTAVSNAALTPSSANPIMDGTAAPGVLLTYARGDHIHPTDTSRAPLASPTFTGDPKAPTPTAGDNDTSIATTAFVVAAVAAGGGGGGGIPEAPTDGQQYGRQSVAWSVILPPSASSPLMDGTAAAGTAASVSRSDHVHPTDTSRAPLASPTFTGDPKAPTPTAGDNDTSIATTAFVTTAVARPRPTVTFLTASSGTYTVPAGALWLEVYFWGGGGGGQGTGTSPNVFVAGSNGTKSTFNSIDAAPGSGCPGTAAPSSPGGAGGTGGAGAATRRVPGQGGFPCFTANAAAFGGGGYGGGTFYASSSNQGPGALSANGINGAANSGQGGSGATNNAGSNNNLGGGGGGGESVFLLIIAPAASYTYALGSGGAGGSSTNIGGTGGTGGAMIIEHYGT